MTTLSDLAQRVQQSEGPSRDLDAEIATACGYRVKAERKSGRTLRWMSPALRGSWRRLPSYTASVDAVLNLIGVKLPGKVWGLEQGTGHAWARFRAPSNLGEIGDVGTVIFAKTPALALLSALLLALVEKEMGSS